CADIRIGENLNCRGRGLEEDADALDLDALIDVAQDSRGIGPAEVGLLRTGGLRGLGGALAGRNVQIDTVLGEYSFLYPVVEGGVLTIGIPVEHQRHRGGLPVGAGVLRLVAAAPATGQYQE